MTNMTDISKLYSLMEADPGKYKEITSNEHKVRMAMRNWPLVRAMATPPIDIPPVLIGEKFENKVNAKPVSRPVRESVQRNNKSELSTKTSRTAVSVGAESAVTSESQIEENTLTTELVGALDALKSAIAQEAVNAIPTVDALNIIDLSKRKANDTVKIRMVNKQISDKLKLGSLFSRLEGAHTSDGNHLNLLKLRRV